MKQFIGDCVGNPFKDVETLSEIIDNATEIGRTRFLNSCDVLPEIKKEMYKYPRSYSYWINGGTMFYCWSAIEHFYS